MLLDFFSRLNHSIDIYIKWKTMHLMTKKLDFSYVIFIRSNLFVVLIVLNPVI